MCLIISKPKNKHFPLDDLECAYYTNSDSFGAMWVQDGHVQVEKLSTPKNFDDVKAMYERHADKNVAYHLRFTTHGKTNNINCHPIQVLNKNKHGRDLFMMHNGILGVDIKKPNLSDTWHFVQNYLKPCLISNPRLIYHKNFQEMLSKTIGAHNKLLFLDNNGRTIIINRKAGSEHVSGCWISNTYSINGAKLSRGANVPAHLTEDDYLPGTYNHTQGITTTYPRKPHNTSLVDLAKLTLRQIEVLDVLDQINDLPDDECVVNSIYANQLVSADIIRRFYDVGDKANKWDWMYDGKIWWKAHKKDYNEELAAIKFERELDREADARLTKEHTTPNTTTISKVIPFTSQKSKTKEEEAYDSLPTDYEEELTTIKELSDSMWPTPDETPAKLETFTLTDADMFDMTYEDIQVLILNNSGAAAEWIINKLYCPDLPASSTE